MAEIGSSDVTRKLLATGFTHSGPSVEALSDPIADTPMVITLDQLRPYDHDPRMKRNPSYDGIKASVRERGLDAPPAITRRPGAEHYMIRNGGNTRLAILRELWTETRDEQFFRIACLFRPWPQRGEIVALTGHLAENELRGGLTFIERALGVEKAREFYEQENNATLSQSELARRLAADGYPVQQSHISRMTDAIRYFLPAIPRVLYAGLGRHQVERLAVMRNAAERVWQHYAKSTPHAPDFDSFFQDALTPFDEHVDEFSLHRVQDELIGQMSGLLDVDYDVLSLDLHEGDGHHRQRPAAVAPRAPVSDLPQPSELETAAVPHGVATTHDDTPQDDTLASVSMSGATPVDGDVDRAGKDERLHEHVVSEAPTTQRLQSIQRMVADQLGDAIPPDFEANVLQAIPVQAGGLYPISDIWYIDPALDNVESLRTHIAQFAQEITEESDIAHCVQASVAGLGFRCADGSETMSPTAHALVGLLRAISGQDEVSAETGDEPLFTGLAPLLYGRGNLNARLSDTALVKLFRLLRLARRLAELDASTLDPET